MTRRITDYVWRLCEQCSVRNCKREPKITPQRTYMCRKRVQYNMANKMLDLCIENSPTNTLKLLHEHKLQVTEGKKGLRLSQKGAN